MTFSEISVEMYMNTRAINLISPIFPNPRVVVKIFLRLTEQMLFDFSTKEIREKSFRYFYYASCHQMDYFFK